MPKKTGRPPVTLPKDWQKKVLAVMGDGGSKLEVARELGISRDTLYELVKRDQAFSDTIKRGEDLCEAWWEKQGRQNLDNPRGFNAVLWYMNMKNRFGWKDKQETELSGGVTVQWLK